MASDHLRHWAKPWKQITAFERVLRCLTLLGGAIYLVCWLGLADLKHAAIAAPAVPTGVFRNFYAFNGCVRYLDDRHAALAHMHLDRFLVLGWCIAMSAMIGLLISAQRAARAK